MNDAEIINIFFTAKGKINSHLTRSDYLDSHIIIKQYLENRYKDSLSLQETLYRIKNNIAVRPVCKVCGKQVAFLGGNKGFRETCSVSCSKHIVNNADNINDYNIILNDIIENGILNNNKLQEKYLKDHGYYNYLTNIYPTSVSVSEKIYRLYYNIEIIPYCKECGKQLTYKNFIIGYGEFCNNICKEKYDYRTKKINDDVIINLLFKKDEPIYPRFEKDFLDSYHIYDYIANRFNDSGSITETIYRIKNRIYEKPKCKICERPLNFIKYSIGFGDNCSVECKYKLLEQTHNNIDDQYIKEHFLNSDSNIKNACNIRVRSLKSKNVYLYLENRFENCSANEAIYRIKYNIVERPKCPICKKELKFRNIKLGYTTYCSSSCANKALAINRYKKLGFDVSFNNGSVLINNACEKHPQIELGVQSFWKRIKNNENICPICNPHKTTSIEDLVKQLLDKHNIGYKIHDRQQIYPYELDFYIPDYNLAIECNGIYWHSDYIVEKTHHQYKLQLCKLKNIKLLTFWENDILNNIDKIESIILSVCYLNKRIFARKCLVKEIDSKTSKIFLDLYHLQGNINASIRLGLFYNDELVEVMTFGKTRAPLGGKQIKGEFELYRLCSKSGYTIVGGASKLLQYFKDHFDWNKIISYCQNDISDGNVYKKIGFKFDSDCGLSYCYFDKQMNKINRYSLRKSVIDDDSGRTADEIIKSLGYLKCWNSGNKKYILCK